MTKRLLELFCGTKSVGKVFENNGYEVISLDYDKKFEATHIEDILKWDYTIYPQDYFDVVWASPDCVTWSVASGGKYRKKDCIYGKNNEYQSQTDIGNNMILKVIEIIKYFTKANWFIENPRGLLQYYPPLNNFIDEVKAYKTCVYYGNYNDWGCLKPTNIWSNLPLWTETKPKMSDDKYIIHGGRRVFKSYSSGNAKERSKIPSNLIQKLLDLTKSQH